MLNNIDSNLPEAFINKGLTVQTCEATLIPQFYINQLVAKSHQRHVSKLDVKEDGSGRFASKEAFAKWSLSTKKYIYFLLSAQENKDYDIAGIVWLSDKKSEYLDPIYDLTFGVRLYEGYLGKGLSVPFMGVVHDEADKNFVGRSMWLETDKNNLPACRAYHKLGYKDLAEHGDRIVMGYKK